MSENPGSKSSLGTLWLAASSLGDNRDIPNRTLELMRTADLLIFEEDRPARQVLKSAGVHREYLKYNEHGGPALDEIGAALKAGKTVVYVSDQGSPTLEDPGTGPLKLARQIGATIKVVPGPSSLTAALSACSFAGKAFYFGGFLPRDTEQRQQEISRIDQLGCPWAVMDTPYRLTALLDSCIAITGPSRLGLLALDISGEQEAFLELPLAALRDHAEKQETKLNFVLIVSGRSAASGSALPAHQRIRNSANAVSDAGAGLRGQGKGKTGPAKHERKFSGRHHKKRS